MHRRILILCALLLALSGLLGQAPRPARADVAPPPPPHGIALYPQQPTTRVQMTAEWVLIEAVANRADQVPYAKVDATFLMRNNGSAEEQMQVHYPLSALYYPDGSGCEYSPYQSIRRFEVMVNGQAVSYGIKHETVPNPLAASDSDPLEVDRACWATFPAVFPPGKDVTIRVRFEQEAGVEGYPGYANYLYVLESGAGWDGPIGIAELTFRAPWQLTEETLLHHYPVDGTVEGTEIHWWREDFEPARLDNLLVQTINPAVYHDINRGRLLYAGSRQGAIWARYALAAKQAILGKRGFRDGEWGERLYHESFDAYTHAVALQPWDADLKAGFAELLCVNAAYPTFDLEWSEEERWSACAGQIQAALAAYPRQPLALRLLEWYGGDPRWLYLENGTPVYPILSVTPPPRRTLTPTPTETPIPSETPIPPTATQTPTVTVTGTATATTTSMSLAEIQATSGPASASGKPGGPGAGLCGAAFLPAAALVLLRKKRRSA